MSQFKKKADATPIWRSTLRPANLALSRMPKGIHAVKEDALIGPLKLRDVVLGYRNWEVEREETIIYVASNTTEVNGDTDAFLMVLERPSFRPEGLVYFLELSVIRSVMDALEQNGLHCLSLIHISEPTRPY